MKSEYSVKLNHTTTQSEPEKRVLIVEDDPFWQTLMRAYFDGLNMAIVIDFAVDVKDAQVLLEYGEQYDVVIADYQLKGDASGLDLYKSIHTKLGAPAFILTSSSHLNLSAEELGECLKFVHKNELRPAIRLLVNKPTDETEKMSFFTRLFGRKQA